MATMALPIQGIQHVIVSAERVQTETRTVVCVSKSAAATVRLTVQVFTKTIALRRRLNHLVDEQAEVLDRLKAADFMQRTPEQLHQLVGLIDDLVKHERSLLHDASTLDVPIRVWWESAISKLKDQVDSFDFIADSAILAADREAASLAAVTADEMRLLVPMPAVTPLSNRIAREMSDFDKHYQW